MELDKLTHFFFNLFVDMGLAPSLASLLNVLLSLFCVLVAAYFISKLLRIVLVKIFQTVFSRSETQFDDFFIANKVFINLTNLFMLFIVKAFVPIIFVDFENYTDGVNTLLNVLILFSIIWTIRSFFNTLNSYLKTLETFKNKPVDSYVQVVMIFVWMFGFILVFSLITGDTPWEFLTAMGAISAIILLIFKDTILGFVASIQISVNDTVRIGDWITMKKFDADGDVLEINLNTVLVQNWDKTITSIPTYYLNSEAFTNWRGMEESGGRRIKRSILIKSPSIRFLTAEEIQELEQITLLKDYLQEWKKEVGNKRKGDTENPFSMINNRNLTNIGVFRKYVNLYLEKRPDIRNDYLMICRQLESTPYGVPLEIYAFFDGVSFMDIEPVQGDIFDHLFAILPYFHLKTFEHTSGETFTIKSGDEKSDAQEGKIK